MVGGKKRLHTAPNVSQRPDCDEAPPEELQIHRKTGVEAHGRRLTSFDVVATPDPGRAQKDLELPRSSCICDWSRELAESNPQADMDLDQRHPRLSFTRPVKKGVSNSNPERISSLYSIETAVCGF